MSEAFDVPLGVPLTGCIDSRTLPPMVEPITSKQFHEAPGVQDWRVPSDGAAAYFATGSFAKGPEFADRIGALAAAANHHPDIDLRYRAVLIAALVASGSRVGQCAA